MLVLTTTTVALTTTLIFAHASHAVASTTKTINFQGRLLTASGAVVPDGNYNIQFKIYQGGTGTAAGNPDGTLDWTESHINGNSTGIEVKDGFLSVNLGAINAFGSSVDWNQSNLWLSMNVAGSAAGCSTFDTAPCLADGEMLPMKQITATPNAINSEQLGGITADGFIQNTTAVQTANLNISGSAIASTLQGNTSVISPIFDTTSGGTLTIGQTNASTIAIADGTNAQTINVGTGGGIKTVTLGSTHSTSSTTIQGGSGGVAISSVTNITLGTAGNSQLNLISNGDANIKLGNGGNFNFFNNSNNPLLSISDNGDIATRVGTAFIANGSATFDSGITIQGTGTYVSPLGSTLSSAINIPNYTVPAYGSIMSFGLPSTSAATARGILIADARTGNHQATIGVLSPDENSIMGLTWGGSNSTGILANTASTLALQGNGLNLLTATNNNGTANIGIGNSASSGYALDVSGDINSSNAYRINGVSTLTNSSLAFSGTTTSTVTSATAQSLDLNGIAGVNIKNNGTTSATFGSNVQIGDGSGTGTPTLLTLDSASTNPGTAMLGSMYYDTTLGQVQCYEASGWGNCTASPDDFVSLSPAYSNAVMHGSTDGTMTSDLCSDALNINDGSSAQPTICGTNETHNYYNWTSTSATSQTRSIYVTYQLPSNFKEFIAGSTSLTGLTNSTDATISYDVYKNTTSGLVACGTTTSVSTGVQTAWQKATATSSADPSSCSFSAGDSIVFKINLTSANNANAYASTLNFVFSNH